MDSVTWQGVLGFVVAALAVDRLFTFFESRGWMYWRRVQAKGTGVNSALLELQAIMQPQVRNVVEAKRKEPAKDVEDGDPPHT